MRQCDVKSTSQKWEKADRDLANLLEKQQAEVHEALSDNFDTPRAVNELFTLVRQTNTYISQPPAQIKVPLVREVSRYVYRILACFGLYDDDDFPKVAQ